MAETLVNKTQAGNGIWTQDNLIAGNNVTITRVEKPVIDSNTLGVWHFDGNTENAVSGSNITITPSITFTYATHSEMNSFGQYAMPDNGELTLFESDLPISSSMDWTLDGWVNVNWSGNSSLFVAKTTYGSMTISNGSSMKWSVYNMDQTEIINEDARVYEKNKWYHLAIEKYGTIINYYANGILFARSTNTYAGHTAVITNMNIVGSSSGNYRYDELRLSNVARYQGQDFIPFAEPYAPAGGPAQYQINSTQDISGKLENAATGTNALTIAGTAATTAQSHNVGDSSSADIYGASYGYSATASTAGTAIGTRASAGNYGVAIGSANGAGSATTATGSSAIAIGYNAKATANTAIQIGTGTNDVAGTVKIKDTTILDANGKIPSANLDTAFATVATSGSYNDLSNKPTIPTVDQTYSASSTNAQSGVAVAEALENVPSIPLFYHTFADHLFNDTSWLRADTFSWQSGSVYTSAYQHLVDDISGKTAETETISGITITFYRANDGHKICLANQEGYVSDLYDATGIAWYYVLDTANTRFKLPRMLPLGDTAPVVGNGMTIGWTNGTQNFGVSSLYGAYGSENTNAYGTQIGRTDLISANVSDATIGLTTDPTKSGIIANLSHTTNDGAYKYLYFYCGNTVQGQTTIDVGQITETLNRKADTDLSNVPSSKGILVESYVNGTSWYRVYSDGWCEQGGQGSVGSAAWLRVTFLKPFTNTNYNIQASFLTTTGSFVNSGIGIIKYANTYADISVYGVGFDASWRACGYIS